jgi:quinol monooxygenase YgiN
MDIGLFSPEAGFKVISICAAELAAHTNYNIRAYIVNSICSECTRARLQAIGWQWSLTRVLHPPFHGAVRFSILNLGAQPAGGLQPTNLLRQQGEANERKGEFMIHVIATIHTAPGRRDDFLAAFSELVPDVRAEVGCLEYSPAVDLDTKVSSQPARADVVTVMEKWASVEALEGHLAAPHMRRYRDRVKDIVAGLKIQVLEPA